MLLYLTTPCTYVPRASDDKKIPTPTTPTNKKKRNRVTRSKNIRFLFLLLKSISIVLLLILDVDVNTGWSLSRLLSTSEDTPSADVTTMEGGEVLLGSEVVLGGGSGGKTASIEFFVFGSSRGVISA